MRLLINTDIFRAFSLGSIRSSLPTRGGRGRSGDAAEAAELSHDYHNVSVHIYYNSKFEEWLKKKVGVTCLFH